MQPSSGVRLGDGGGDSVSLLSMPRLSPGAAGPGGAVPVAAALALPRFVVIGNRTAEEPGCCFYGNVLEQ